MTVLSSAILCSNSFYNSTHSVWLLNLWANLGFLDPFLKRYFIAHTKLPTSSTKSWLTNV